MKKKLLSLFAALSVGVLAAKAVTFTNIVDTASEFSGEWSASFDASGVASGDFDSYFPTIFSLLPNSTNDFRVELFFSGASAFTEEAGTPDDPSVQHLDAPTGESGYYNNNASNTRVDWRIYDLAYQNANPIFNWSGKFEFKVASVPDTSSTAALAGLGIAILAAIRRRSKNSCRSRQEGSTAK